jgi:methylaspartate ammonia-lyase
MARVVLVKQGGLHTIFQIGSGVGLNRPNSKGDVALVQFFLEQSRRLWGGSRAVNMDGICGRVTIEAILEFQHAVNRNYKMPIVKTDSGQLHLFFHARSARVSSVHPQARQLQG